MAESMFKYVGEDPQQYFVQRTDNQEVYPVNKAGIDESTRNHIFSLKEVGPEPTPVPVSTPETVMAQAQPSLPTPAQPEQAQVISPDQSLALEKTKIDPGMLRLPQKEPEIKPVDRGGLLKPLEESEKQLGQTSKAVAESYKAASKMMDLGATQAKIEGFKFEEEEEKLKSDLDRMRLEIDTARDEASKVAKINPQNFWNNKGTGDKILAAIAVVLGGVGAGLTGQKNMALEIINRSIEQDIEAQKSAIEGKRADLAAKMNAYGMVRQALGDTRAAKQVAMASAYTDAERKVQAMLMQAKGAEEVSRLQQLQSEIGMKKKALEIEAQKLMEQAKLRNAMYSGAGVTPNIIDQSSFSPEEKKMYKENFVPGVGMAKDKETAAAATKIKSASDAFQAQVKNLIKETEAGPIYPGTPRAAKLQTLVADVQLAYKDANAMGTLDKGSQQFMEKVIQDPTSLFNINNIEKYQAILDANKVKTAAQLKAFGLTPSQDRFKAREIPNANR